MSLRILPPRNAGISCLHLFLRPSEQVPCPSTLSLDEVLDECIGSIGIDYLSHLLITLTELSEAALHESFQRQPFGAGSARPMPPESPRYTFFLWTAEWTNLCSRLRPKMSGSRRSGRSWICGSRKSRRGLACGSRRSGRRRTCGSRKSGRRRSSLMRGRSCRRGLRKLWRWCFRNPRRKSLRCSWNRWRNDNGIPMHTAGECRYFHRRSFRRVFTCDAWRQVGLWPRKR